MVRLPPRCTALLALFSVAALCDNAHAIRRCRRQAAATGNPAGLPFDGPQASDNGRISNDRPTGPPSPSQLPYSVPDISNFNPTVGKFASVAGDYAASMCTYLGANLPAFFNDVYSLNSSFAQYYPEGSNPSIELLTDVYPDGVLDQRTERKLSGILSSLGSDVDIKRDFGYGKANTRAAGNGPLGGLPAFCRLGGFIQTSHATWTFFEAWLPLASDPNIPLVPPNVTDFPRNSTPIYLGPKGEFLQAPANLGDLNTNDPSENGIAFDDPDDLDDDTGLEVSDSTKDIGIANTGLKRRAAPPAAPNATLQGDAILGNSDGWNGRIFFVGNGAQRGFVPIPDLKQMMSRYRFAVMGSNLGHFGGSSDVGWVAGPQPVREERLMDFIGGRSHAIVLDVGRGIVNLFYGPDSGVRSGDGDKRHVRSYVAGCSVGGAGTLSAILNYPDSFDGALAGCPAVNFTALNYAQIGLQARHRKSVAGPAYFSDQTFQSLVRTSVLQECDHLDKVTDGVITLPELCTPNFGPILCRKGQQPSDGCLIADQVLNLARIYQPTMLEGQQVYPGFLPGAEESGDVLEGEAHKAIHWLLLADKGELNVTKQENRDAYADLFTLDEIRQWQQADLMGSDVSKTNLAPFFKNGGKLIHYAGLADLRISPLASRNYYNRVHSDKENAGIDIDQSYRYFEIPGMKHCRDGSGPWQIGAVTQTDPGNRPLRYDSESDVILALVAWVERGIAPQHLVGASYAARSAQLPTKKPDPDHNRLPVELRSYEYGVAFSRLICPYPLRPVAKKVASTAAFTGPDAHLNFECKNVDLPSAAPAIASAPKAVLATHVFLVTLALLLLP
ncbi:uncharacterized protein PFL1_04203 [Pseudozyma flocculosa PF-1]|uniref:Carboxylic ester hydrolase n=2 Tax=Pseudozyma flocculosa TaxID=84751 RepID=A0A5C3EUJ0_9BASI|nr:uncharacterized protein PFL1_04203 [Pseudozyma flocculosa PF-1]EPQ28376.1 hypothetical protein PFL1_04203 [Pseudozyma flocculosa PF-1]SPO35530.1 uncharacterized protein PSFLO_01001 [Pseudozyma flocculosa]